MTTPLEALSRGFLRGPIITKANSSPSQWAGTTTLNSGSASVVVSTNQVNSDSLIFSNLRVSIPAAYGVQGITNLVSADNYGTASTSAVYSGQVIQYGLQHETAVASGTQRQFRVNSIVDGVSFALTTQDSMPVGVAAATLMWRIPQAEPEKIVVNTISSGNYFTFGWADKTARPIDVNVLWEVRKTS